MRSLCSPSSPLRSVAYIGAGNDGSSSLRLRYSAPVSRAALVQAAPNSTPDALTRWSGAFSLSRSQGRILALTRSVRVRRSEEHTSELQSLMRISYAVFCLKNKQKTTTEKATTQRIEL